MKIFFIPLVDLPTLISGTKVAFFEPQMKIWKGKPGKSKSLATMQQQYPDSLLPFHDIGGFTSRGMTSYPHTLFRFPLRKVVSASLLSSNCYDASKLSKLIEALKDEAEVLLLFLRSVERVEALEIRGSGEKLLFSVQIEKNSRSRLQVKRKALKEGLTRSFSANKCYGIQRPISFTESFTVTITGPRGHAISQCQWLVSNLVGSPDQSVKTAANEQRTFPWVGTAIQINTTEFEGGRIFCVLPMPSETVSDLPVHINGTFGLNDDRRSLKWPGKERTNDGTAQWNKLLVEKVISQSYVMLLKEALKHLSGSDFYDIIPDVNKIKNSNWEGLLKPISSALFLEDCKCLWSRRNKWVNKEEALFVEEEDADDADQVQVSETLQQVLEDCGYHVVSLPPNMWRALELVCDTDSLLMVTPKLVRKALQDNRHCYECMSHADKLELLEYCLSDSEFSDLQDLCLLPLANDEFDYFCRSGFQPCSTHYVCSKDCPLALLPNAEQHLVDLPDHQDLHDKLKTVAESNKTNLQMLDASSVAHLLSFIFPADWQNKTEVVQYDFPLSWYNTFWKWLRKHNHSLGLFVGKFIIPIEHPDTPHFSVMRLEADSNIVLVHNADTYNMAAILDKLGVKYTTCEHLRHGQLSYYLKPFTSDGVLQAIAKTNRYSTTTHCQSFSREEAKAFQSFLVRSRPVHLSQHQKVLQNLAILLPVGDSAPVSYRMAGKSKNLVVEPSLFLLEHTHLPSSLLVLSQSEDQSKILQAISGVSFSCTTADFILKHIFTLIHSGEFRPPTNITPLMQEILKLFTLLSNESRTFEREVSQLPFLPHIPHSYKLARPKELRDPDPLKSQLSLYKGEHVFPLSPFNQSCYLSPLRKCGLKITPSAQDLYDILTQVSGGANLFKAGEPAFSRAKAVFKYFQQHPITLTGDVYKQSYYRLELKDAIHQLAEERSILPIEASPPDGYPQFLSWKGLSCSSHLSTMNSSVLPCSSEEMGSICRIVGSQVYLVCCPTELCALLRPTPPVEEVVRHLLELIQCTYHPKAEKIIHEVYQYLSDNFEEVQSHCFELYSCSWIWLKHHSKCVQPKDVFLEAHPDFHDLSPYLYLLPDSYDDFHYLFTHFGAHEAISSELLVSLLSRIKDCEIQDSDAAWRVVRKILNWVTDDGKRHANKSIASQSNLYVPIDSVSDYPELEKVEDVVYVDMQYLKTCFKSRKGNLKFIHKDFHHLAPFLGVTPLSKEINISEDIIGDAGQSEPLVQRLKNILRDYRKEGSTIIKELIQNADDAEADEVNICYDARSHMTDDEDGELIFPGMNRAHGPALIFHNNSVFSESDFTNIQKLAGATKRDQPLKIGKFGVGFCSVYHITDIPSFVSGDHLFIFDPTTTYLADQITDPMKPGKKLHFTNNMVRFSKQMCPFIDMFGFEEGVCYEGTMFRLPFRTQPSALSGDSYGKEEVEQLLSDVEKSAPNLLLFLQHVKSLTFSQIDEDGKGLTEILKVSKHTRPVYDEDPFMINDEPLGTEVTITVRNCQLDTTTCTTERWLITESQEGKQISAVACLLEEIPDSSSPCTARCAPYSTTSEVCSFPDLPSSPTLCCPIAVTGEAFCFLPLHLRTGLPVHVSANFAVMNDRTGIHSSDSDSKSEQSRFNVSLMKESIPVSYHKLLLLVKHLELNGRIRISGDTFYSLWPDKDSLETHNPWDFFVPKLYRLIASSALFYSGNLSKWQNLSDSCLLSKQILQPEHRDEIEEVVRILGKPLIHLPITYQAHLPQDIVRNCTINEVEFLRIFFRSIRSIPIGLRNTILLSLINSYYKSGQSRLKDFITCNRCIPCEPDGTRLRKCDEVINPSTEIGSLYEPEDYLFPIPCFLQSPMPLFTLKDLGMIEDHLPWNMVVERARTVKNTFHTDQEKALNHSKILLGCVALNRPPLPLELTTIPFLPVMSRPSNYPKELHWKGTGVHLLSSSELLVGDKNNVLLVGSTHYVTDIPADSKAAVSALQISKRPSSVEDVINHLSHIVDVHNLLCKKPDHVKWIDKACKEIYKYLDEAGSSCESLLERFHNPPGLIWSGKEFIQPESIATQWKHNGPHLYSVPSLLTYRTKLKEMLQIKEKFDRDQLLQALADIKDRRGDGKVSAEEERMIPDIAEKIADCLDEDTTLEPDDEVCYLLDSNLRMRMVQNLVHNDVGWCSIDETVHCVYHKINPEAAMKLGVKSVRSKALDPYETQMMNYFDGSPFGQQQELTQRIREILRSYTNNETVLKELLQNADDAKARKLYFILDKRTHGNKRVPSDSWKELQGPALLVWNDKGFTEDDFRGIQMLGVGSKRSRSESIGQYGIGFNVVYHLTDCPSFLTNDSTLCILDPHCRYIPGANVLSPGRRLDNMDEKFWSNWSDLKPAYLCQEGSSNCPIKLDNGGTLFRFPLRWSEELVSNSELVDHEDEDTVPLTAEMMDRNLRDWAPKMKESLLFLKHVTELRFYVIEEDKTCVLTHHFSSELDSHAKECRRELLERNASFAQRNSSKDPYLTSYTLRLLEKAPDSTQEEWLVQQGVGDISNPSQNWQYLDRLHMTPMHGLATKTNGGRFVPKIFCFLPLPLKSELPVHVNGKFILESSSRSSLWRSRDTEVDDDYKRWNNRIIEALAASYADFLIKYRSLCVDNSYTKARNLQEGIDKFYKAFPRWISDKPDNVLIEEMMDLSKKTYEALASYSVKNEVFVTVQKEKSPHKSGRACYHTNWQPVLADDPSQQVYFWAPTQIETSHQSQQQAAEQGGQPAAPEQRSSKEVFSTSFDEDQAPKKVWFWSETDDQKSVPPILKRLGMQLTAAPCWIREHFAAVEVNIPKITRETVFEYYSSYVSPDSFPCKIADTPFRNVQSFKLFVQYVVEKMFQTKGSKTVSFAQFQSDPFGLPLLLTADGFLRVFDKNNKVLSCRFSKIYDNPKCMRYFLHPDMLSFNFNREYFVQSSEHDASSDNWELISTILEQTLSSELQESRVKLASNYINVKDTLCPLWKCLHEDHIFKEHKEKVVKLWALILSSKDEAFRYDPGSLLPVEEPRELKEYDDGSTLYNSEKDILHRKVCAILKSVKMPTVHKEVVKSIASCRGSCTKFYSDFSEPEKILSNLCHLYRHLKHGNSVSVFDTIHDNVDVVFSYFSAIHFHDQHSQESLQKIKSLPLFKNVTGTYCSLSDKKVYFWPNNVSMAGVSTLLTNSEAVFLTTDGPWKKLTDPGTLGIEAINPFHLYIWYLFPLFYRLTEEERIEQLLHIKENLFELAKISSKYSTEPVSAIYQEFIDGLKNLPVLLQNGKPSCVSGFITERHSIFELFPDNYTRLPEALRSPEWISFLEDIGLQMEPTQREFEDFCHQISKGCHSDVKKASGALLSCLFRMYDWHEDENFLSRIGKIPFVCANTVEDLGWILPACKVNVHYIQQKDTEQIRLVSLQHCASHKDRFLVWTVLPVAWLPDVSLSPSKAAFMKSQEKKNHKETFLSHLGVQIKPTASQVVSNIRNLTQSKFADFKLFSHYTQDYHQKATCVPKRKKDKEVSLVDVVVKNLNYLTTPECHDDNSLSQLQDLPCIPVSSDNTDDSSKPVLVHPLQVVISDTGLDKSLHPFLCTMLPEMQDLSHAFLTTHLGMHSELHVDNILFALELIKTHVRVPLDVNTEQSVKTLLIMLYKRLVVSGSELVFTRGSLYLPSIDGQNFLKSTDLVYNDRWNYRQETFDFSQVPGRSMLSLLCKQNEVNDEYEFTLTQFVSKLPPSLAPKPLSDCCSEVLHHDCQKQECSSEFALALKRSFQRKERVTLVEKILKHGSHNSEACTNFVSSLKSLMDSIEIVNVQNLKVDIMFDDAAARVGSAYVDFLLENSQTDDQYILCVDSSARSIRYRILENLAHCIASEVYKMSGVDPESLMTGNTEEAIRLMLQVESPDDVKALLSDLGISSSGVNLEDTSTDFSDFSWKLGQPIPTQWHCRLHTDLDIIFKPQELVGYEQTENNFIVARVEYRVLPGFETEGPEEVYDFCEEDQLPEATVLCAAVDFGEEEADDSAHVVSFPVPLARASASHLDDSEPEEGLVEPTHYSPSTGVSTDQYVMAVPNKEDALAEESYHSATSSLDEDVEEEEEVRLNQYVITVAEDDNESSKITVSVLDIYKIMWIKETGSSSDISDLVLYDSTSEAVSFWDMIKDTKLKDMLRMIYRELKRISKIRDKDKQRKARKAMYLKWHPDRNSNPLASEAFLYLKRQIDRIKKGLDIEDPDQQTATESVERETFHNPTFSEWEEVIRQRTQAMWSGYTHQQVRPPPQPVPNKAMGRVWLQQGENDLKAVEVMLQAAELEPSAKLFGQVCFLSHQAAEKTLKAGMIALFGSGHYGHDLRGNAMAILDCDSSLEHAESKIYSLARSLESYYLNTRYPDRWSGQVPCNCYSIHDARGAAQAAREIFQTVSKSI